MQKLVRDYLNELKRKQKKRKRVGTAVVLLVILVIGTVIGGLTQAGVAMTGNAKCGIEEHEHSDGCYENVLACGQEEGESHQHGEGCYTTETRLSCGMDEAEGHQHDDSCYDEAGNLICGTEEAAGHQHDDSCYTTEEVLTCEQEEGEGHTHSDACYEKELACKKEEHTHTEECYIDKKADVEDSSKWDEQYKDTEWKETWAENLVIAAEAQIGYKESEDNYEVAEDGSHKGYTRYGQFMDDVYADWDAAFVNFCMHYAGKDDINIEASEVFPKETEAVKWYEEFTKADEKNMSYLVAPQGYEPKAGELVFFDRKDEEPAFQMGIVSSYDEEKNEIKVIEGNSDNEVKENEYGIKDEDIEENHIFAYLKMDEVEEAYKASKKTDTEENDQKAEEDQKDENETSGDPAEAGQKDAEKPEETVGTEEVKSEEIQKVYTSEKFTVTASYPKEANIPEEAEFKAEEVAAEGNEEHYAEREAEFKKAMGDEKASMKALLKVGFYVNGEEVEPESPVTLTIQFLDENGLKEGSPITVVHFAEKGTEVLDGGKAKDNSATFQMGSFSEIAIGEGIKEEATAKEKFFPINKSFLYESELYQITFHIVGNACEKKEDVVETDKTVQKNGETAENSEASDITEATTAKVESTAGEVIADEIDADTEAESKYRLTVKTLDKESSEYQDFSKYAEETGEGETQIGFQVMQYSLSYDDVELDLTDCEVTAEISTTETLEKHVKKEITSEEQLEEEAEETEETEELPKFEMSDNKTDSLIANSIESGSVQENILGTISSETERDNALSLDAESLEEENEDDLLVTVYGVTENEEMGKLGETVIPEEKLNEPVQAMTVSLTTNMMAVDTSSTPNPRFTVQYYSELERVERLSAQDNTELNTLVQDVKNETTGNGKFQKQKEIVRKGYIPVINTEGAKLPQNELNQSVLYLRPNSDGSVKTNKVMTKIYKDRTTEYRRQPNLNYFDALLKNDSYNLAQIWVLNGSATSGTKICTEHRHNAECLKDGKVVCGKEEHTTHTVECYSENWRKIDYVRGEIHFTNRRAVMEADPTHYVYIADNAKLRLVYSRRDPKSESLGATFYDYDISSKNRTDNSAKVMDTKNGGINAVGRTNNNAAQYAFGNMNCGTNYGTLLWGTNLLNKGNQDNVYKGCTFGMVTGMTGSGDSANVVFNSQISAPNNLFVSEDVAGAKKVYKNGNLTYIRDGDTYTLTSANSTVGNAPNLHLFMHPSYYNPTTEKNVNNNHVWTNNFWPMDNVTWQTRTDFNFGEAGKQNVQRFEPGKNSDHYLPVSDDGKNHNSFFGMKHQVNFKLSADYVGPLEYYFFGDDDLWVFLDNQLVCDVGGVHSSVGEYVNLWNYLEQGSEGEHTLSFFYTERGASGSTCWMQFTLPSVTTDSITTTEDYYGKLRVDKKVEQNDGEVKYTGNDEFEFEIFFTGANGETLGDDFPYTKHDASGKELEYNVVLHDGSIFKLKNGEYIVVHDIPVGTKYTIREKSGSVHVGNVDYAYSPNITIDGQPIKGADATGSIPGGNTSNVIYTNKFSVYKLPSTGGSGIYWYMFGGVLLMAGAMLITYRNKRREVLRS